MTIISTARLEDCRTDLPADAIRAEVIRFAELLSAVGVPTVRVWCSWNPDLPDDSPLQSPRQTLPPGRVPDFLDAATRQGVWAYGDVWNRAGVDALDGSFTFLLGNDRDIRLETRDRRLLESTRAAWVRAGYEVRESEGDGNQWVRVSPTPAP